MRLSYVSIVSPDIVRLRDFYADVLGLAEITEWTHDGFFGLDVGDGVVLALHSTEAYAELGTESPAHGAMGTMLTFDPGGRPDVDRVASALLDRGVTVVRQPFDSPYGSRQAIFLDPDGNPFRLNSF